ncbi:hypothetical protein BDZ91DRAFT_852745 [Kalaharituber pfeilii]|nr:hypothetical protein BDZ91DRAFT_852745 [Kalaharituber pfeilii]
MARFTAFVVALLVASIYSTLASPVAEAHDTPPAPRPCPQCTSSPNNCDITAPCSNFLGKLYCGCRPGFRAAGNPQDTNTQWRIDTVPGHEHRVWVAPGVVCNTLCDVPYGPFPCKEVAVKNQCAA